MDEHVEPTGTTKTIGNHVYFYDEISDITAMGLIENLVSLDNTLVSQRVPLGLSDTYPMTPIWLHVCSPGGAAHASFAIADAIKRLRSPVYSIAEGYAASGGTLVSMSCSKRYITPNSFMLIHQLSGAAWGTFEQQKDAIHYGEMLMERIVDFYASRSKMTKKKIKGLLKRDSWFNAAQCIELGLADEILT